jgi:hypothetical protein
MFRRLSLGVVFMASALAQAHPPQILEVAREYLKPGAVQAGPSPSARNNLGPTWVQNYGQLGLKAEYRSSKDSRFSGLLAEACGSRTHHPGRLGQDQWL